MRTLTTAALASVVALCLAAPERAAAQAPPAATVPPAAAPAPPAVDPHVLYAGSYSFVGGDRERNAINAAIERATDGLNFIIRPIANDRIRGASPVPGAVTIRFPPGQVEVLAITGRIWRSPENGPAVPGQGVTGDPVRITSRWENGHLVQILATDEGARRNDYILNADGRTLTLRVTTSSPRLPRSVIYDLTYRR
jgi:hypothetical protein